MTTFVTRPEGVLGALRGPLGDDWRHRAACRSAPPDLFSTTGDDDDEPPYPSPDATAYCDRCDVRATCLALALELPPADDWGVRGGTSAYQRRQMRRVIHRPTCIGCGSPDLVLEGGHELCLGCGLSWYVG